MESDVTALGLAIAQNARDVHALKDRVDYLTVAVMRGDPRFARDEYAKPGFDCAAFDAEWILKGRRVPSPEEVYG